MDASSNRMEINSRAAVLPERPVHRQLPLIHQLFAVQVAARRNEIAVRCGDEQLTYGELDERSNRLAHYLQCLGVGPESLVALYLERGSHMVVAILGVIKAGGAYVPIELAYPAERRRFILEDAKPLVVLTDQKLMNGLPQHSGTTVCLDSEGTAIAHHSVESAPSSAKPENAAYVIYTSGSTGKPKGVVVTHFNVARLFRSTEHWFHFSSSDVWTLFHSFAFDFSVWEMWGALLYGGKLVVVPYAMSRSPAAFHQLLVDERVTVLNQTPSAFRQLIWADEASSRNRELSLRWVIFGGEALELQSLKPWLERHGDQRPRLVNMYGITETTVHVTYRPITREDLETGRGSVIGDPIPDLAVLILDEQFRPCPIGVPGEIFVSGAGVARGYLNRPQLNTEKFIPDLQHSGTGERWYRSGDLARRRPDGDLEYLGRVDHQVKIRGFRVELGEIEAALNSHPNVRECVVVAQGDVQSDKRLVAYLVSRQERPSIDALQEFIKTKLPDYMVPALFVFLDKLPLTVNGKVDRRALPAPNRLRPDLGDPFVPPRTPEEKAIASIWESVLQIDRVGVRDSFFALGGNSLLIAQLHDRLCKGLGIELQFTDLFRFPTVRSLAEYLCQQGETPPGTGSSRQGDRGSLQRQALSRFGRG
jgi:amino acid adenylation domain-containing protein